MEENTLKLPQGVGPFTINTRDALNQVEKLLEEMNLPKIGKYNYDPHNIIYSLSKDAVRELHKHQPNPILERTTNLETWEAIHDIINQLYWG